MNERLGKKEMVVGTWNQKSSNWEDDYINFIHEKYACKRRVPQIEGKARERGSSHGSVCTIERNG
jgi:hypothetical protein